MATIYGNNAVRLRVFIFVPGEHPGIYRDKLYFDVVCNRGDVVRELSAIYENFPADHFAVVCDSLSDTPNPVGYTGPTVELGARKPESGSCVYSVAKGLACHETCPQECGGIGKCPRTGNLGDGGEHPEVSPDIPTRT